MNKFIISTQKAIIIVLILCSFPGLAQNQSTTEVSYPIGNQLFYHLSFGKTSSETITSLKLLKESASKKGDKLFFKTLVNGIPADVILFFSNESLTSYKYFMQKSYDPKESNYLTDFDSVESMLKINYLEPAYQIHQWKDNCQILDSSFWAAAIINGCLDHSIYWELPDRSIALKIIGASDRLMIIVEFKWNNQDKNGHDSSNGNMDLNDVSTTPLFRYEKDRQINKTSPEQLMILTNKIDSSYLLNDKLPIFPGCENQGHSNNLIVDFINQNFRFPHDTSFLKPNEEIEFKMSFFMKNLIPKPSPENEIKYFHQELIRVLSLMPDFLPAVKNGKIYEAEEVFKFKYLEKGIDGQRNDSVALLNVELIEKEAPHVLYIYEEMPLAPGCKSKEDTDRYIQNFIARNLEYPELARRRGVQGKVIVTFVIDYSGRVTQVSLKNSSNPLLNAEAMRVISILPNFTPGYQAGKPVNVGFIVPITFRLNR